MIAPFMILAAAAADPISEVVVSGAPYPVSLDSAATHVEVLTRDRLVQAPPAGLGDMLRGLPGVRSSGFAPGASRPVIRGLSGPRVLVLQNGMGLVDASTLSPDHAVAEEAAQAARVEVLRGPSTLAYGGSAIGGVVNVLDERIPTAQVPSRLAGRFTASAGSGDDSRAFAGAVKAGAGRWAATIDAAARRSEDYRVPDAPVSEAHAAAAGVVASDEHRVRNSDVELEDLGAGVAYVGSAGYLGVSVKRLGTRYGLPFPQVEPVDAASEGPVYIDLSQTRYDLRGERRDLAGPFEQARLSLGHTRYDHSEIERATGLAGTVFRSEGSEARLELVQAVRGPWRGALGVQALRREIEASGDEAFIPPTRIEEAALFAFQRLDFGGWGAEGGLRIERRRLEADLAARRASAAAASGGLDWSTTPRAVRFDNASASAAVFARPVSGWFVSLSVSASRRAPTEVELFADGPHAGTSAFEIGDPGLHSESVASVEGGLRWSGARGRLAAYGYHARYDGFIEEAPTGERVDTAGSLDPAGEWPVFRFRQVDAEFTGAELEAAYVAWRDAERSLTLEAAYDVVRAEAGDGGRLARIPPYSATLRLVWSGPQVEAAGEVIHVGGQDRVAPFETPTAGYTLLNARAAFRLSRDGDLRLFVEGRNLGDVEAREHVSYLKDIAPMPGRALRAGLTLSF